MVNFNSTSTLSQNCITTPCALPAPTTPVTPKCLEEIQVCSDTKIIQGETWKRKFILLDKELTLKSIIPGAAGTGQFVVDGLCTDLVAGDQLILFGTCNLPVCPGLEGCYTVVDVVVTCEMPQETTITVAEELVSSLCTEPIMVNQTFGGYPGCKPTSVGKQPMLGRSLNLIDAELVGKITNRQSKQFGVVRADVTAGSNEIIVCPGNMVECYDVLDVPYAGISQGQVVKIVHETGYDRVWVEKDGLALNATITQQCLNGTVTDGVIALIQYQPVCEGFVAFIAPESEVGVDGVYYRGTNDFMCSSPCSPTPETCDDKEFGFYTIALSYVDSDGVKTTTILANGEVALLPTSLNI